MAKLVLINAVTHNPELNELGDIVQICTDDQPLQAKMLEKFDIVIVDDSIVPESNKNYLFKSTTTEWTLDEPEHKKVWADGDSWKEVIQEPKYKLNYDSKTGAISETYNRFQVNVDAPIIMAKVTVVI